MKTTTYNTNPNPSTTQNINERKELKTMKNTIKKTTNFLTFIWKNDGNFYAEAVKTTYGWKMRVRDEKDVDNFTIYTAFISQLRDGDFCTILSQEEKENPDEIYKQWKEENAAPVSSENNTTTNTPAENNGEKKGEDIMTTYQKVKDNLFHNYLTMTPGTDPAPEYTEITLAEKDILKEARHILIEKLSPKDAPLGYNESLILNIKASIATSYNHIFKDDDNLEDYLIIFKWAEQNYPATYIEFLAAFRSEYETEKAEPDEEPAEGSKQDTAKYFHANTGNWTPENNDQWSDHYKAQFAHHRITGNKQYIKWLKEHEEKGNNAQWIINVEKEIEKDMQIIKEYVQKYGTFSLYGETADYTSDDFKQEENTEGEIDENETITDRLLNKLTAEFNAMRKDGEIYEEDENGKNMSYGEYLIINSYFTDLTYNALINAYELRDLEEMLKILNTVKNLYGGDLDLFWNMPSELNEEGFEVITELNTRGDEEFISEIYGVPEGTISEMITELFEEYKETHGLLCDDYEE